MSTVERQVNWAQPSQAKPCHAETSFGAIKHKWNATNSEFSKYPLLVANLQSAITQLFIFIYACEYENVCVCVCVWLSVYASWHALNCFEFCIENCELFLGKYLLWHFNRSNRALSVLMVQQHTIYPLFHLFQWLLCDFVLTVNLLRIFIFI